jgi:hypothetical protein
MCAWQYTPTFTPRRGLRWIDGRRSDARAEQAERGPGPAYGDAAAAAASAAAAAAPSMAVSAAGAPADVRLGGEAAQQQQQQRRRQVGCWMWPLSLLQHVLYTVVAWDLMGVRMSSEDKHQPSVSS